MKRVYLSLLLSCLVVLAKAQTAGTYVFSQASTTYSAITGTTLFSSYDDNVTGAGAIPLNFPFWFTGTYYTTAGACANGWMNFGATAPVNSYTPLTTAQPRIAAFGEDLYYLGPGGTNTVVYNTIGTAPNRVFTLQWINACHYSTSTTGPYNFQINLYESSNVVETKYGSYAGITTATSYTAHVGIGSAAATTYNNRTTTTNWNATTAGTGTGSTCTHSNTIIPANGLTFRWTPPPTIAVSPATLSGFTAAPSAPSPAQTFTLTAFGLTSGSVTITAPANFEVWNGSAWVTSMTVPTTTGGATVGTYINSPIQVRLMGPATTGPYSGTLTCSSTGATTQNVSLSGNVVVACSGAPTPGTAAVSPTSGSTGTTFTLSTTGYTVAGGITFQWQSSPNGTTGWTDMAGATTASYAYSGMASTTYYRCNVTCASVSTATTNTVSATWFPAPTCIVNAASWVAPGSKTYGINTFNITGYSGSTLADVNIVASSNGNGYIDRTALTPVNLQQNGVYAANSSWGTVSSYQYLCVWIDFNNNGTYEASEAVTPVNGSSPLTSAPPNPTNYNISIPAGAAPGTHLMRIRGIWESTATTTGSVPAAVHPCNLNNGGNPSYYSGTCADYFVNIVALPACSGTPSTGTVLASATTNCTTYSTNLSLSMGATGQTYQWQSSPNNTTWTSIGGATNAGYTATVSVSTYFRCIVTCTSSGLSATSPSQLCSISSCILMPATGTGSSTVCGALFYDNGGPSVNYNNSCNSVYTIYPGAAGSKVRVQFNSFTIEGDPYDYMNIYNGNSTGAPSLGHFTTTSPGTLTSTAADGSLTFQFVSDPSVSYAGWDATISNVHFTPITVQPATTTNACQTIATSIGLTAAGTVTYQWFDNGTTNSTTGGTLIVGATNATYSPSVAALGTKYYYCEVTNACSVMFPSTTAAVVVTALPPSITGALSQVCQGRTITLSNTITTGTWTSNNSTIASVVGAAGTATVTGGATAGATTITYATSPACYVTRAVTTNATPLPVTGTFQLCELGTTTLAHPDGGTGTWSSATPLTTSVGLTSGIVSGLTSGTGLISYTNTNTCVITQVVTVNPLPTVNVTPSTGSVVCLGNGTTFTANSNAPQIPLLTQDFNSGLGSWTVTTVTGTPAQFWQIVPSGGGAAGFPGDGTAHLQAAAMFSATQSIITSPSFVTTGGFTSLQLTFNQFLYSSSPDVAASVEYSINNGPWTTLVNQTPTPGIILDNGGDNTWVVSDPEFSMALPAATIGVNNLRIRFVYNALNLYWLIDNISVKGIMPASSFVWSGAAGLSCTNCAASTLTPTATGTNGYNVAVTTSAGCTLNTPVTVTANPLPANISGSLTLCENVTTTLSSTAGGTWTSSDPTKATIVSGTGAVTGVAAGTTNITYTFSTTGCRTSSTATVLAAPAIITPTVATVCHGSTLDLDCTTINGTWSSSNTSFATVDPSTGLVSGVSPGTVNITYTIPTGCISVRQVVVNPLPAAISGSSVVCEDDYTSFTDTDPLGTWTSANTAIASVNAVSGSVFGELAGNTIITYTLPTGCRAIKAIQVNPIPNAISGVDAVCQGFNTLMSSTSAGATWSSSAPGVAAIDASGIVTTNTSFAGNVILSYTFNTTGCSAIHPFTVNPLPSVSGVQKVCKDATITFTGSIAGGSWSSASSTIAPVDMTTGVITGVTPGNTRITYTLPTGCIGTRTVTVNALPNNINGADAVCEGSTTSMVSTTGGGTWSSSNTSVATISSIGLVTPVATTGSTTISYIVTSTGCYKTKDVAVNPLPGPITGTTTVCDEGTTTLSNASGGGSWSSSNTGVMTIDATSGLGTATGAGSASIVYTLATGCSTSTGVQVNALPDDIFGTLTVCEGRQTTLASTTPAGVWSTSDPLVASVSTIGDVTGNQSGVADIAYTLASGCADVVQVTVNPLPAAITGNFALCTGTSSLLANANSGGVWSSSTPSVATVNTSGNVTGGIVGGATITYALPTGCIRTQAVVVNPLPGSITGTATVCEGLSTDLNNSTAGGSWSSANTGTATVDVNTGLVSGVSAGSVNIVYTLPTGCGRSRAVTVNDTPDPITGTLSACPNGTSMLTSSPANGTWSSGASSVVGINTVGLATGVSAGMANITYMLPGGCRTVSIFTVNPLPSAISGTRTVCQGNTTTLSNAIGGGTWTTASAAIATIDANGILTGVAQGITQVIYELPTGCSRTANVTVNALPAGITGTTTLCEQSTSTLSSASANGSWSSSNAGVVTITSAGVLTAVAPGAATVSYTLPNGCRTTTPVNVNALPANITGATAVCQGQQAAVVNTTGGGTWSIDNTTIASIDAMGNVFGNMPGTAIVKYELTTGCYRTKSFVVNALPAPITGTTGICQGSNTMLSNATPNGSWSSSNPAVAPISSTGSVTAVQVGMSTINYTLSTGCSSNTTVVVNALPEVITGTASVCAGGTTILESVTLGGTWSSSNTVTTVNTAGVVTGVAAGTSTIYYTMGNGCKRAKTVTVNGLPGAISGVNTVCPGMSVTLSNSVPGGSWSSDNGAMAAVNATTGIVTALGADGTANITYTLPSGCQRSRQVTVYPAVDAITGAGAICKNDITTLSNTTPGGTWSSSNAAVASIGLGTGMVTGNAAGMVSIAYVMPTGCKATTTMVINGLPGNISGGTSVCMGSTVNLSNTVNGGTWSSSDDAIATIGAMGSVTGVTPGVVTLTYTLATGCKSTADLAVNELPEVKNVTGSGAYCEGGTGMTINVDGSQAGTLYKLMNGGMTPVLTMTGTGGMVNYLNQLAGVYNVVAVSPQGCMADMNGTAIITVTALATPTVLLSSDKGNTVCAGTAVTYSAAGTNGGATPTYTWNVNGTDVASTPTYMFVPANGDMVTIKYTSSEACPAPATVSNGMRMTVRENLTPAVSVTVGPNDSMCQGSVATFSAAAANGGDAPAYTWLVDGSIVTGATSATYAYMPDNNDVVTARLHSNYACPTTNDVLSNGVSIHTEPVYVPEVEVVPNTGTQVAAGTEVTFTANVKNAGPAPTYQWVVNSKEMIGATTPVFKYAKLKDGDSVTCQVRGTGECSKVSINSVVMEVSGTATGVTVRTIGNSEIRLMPNPNTGVFTVSGTLSTKADETVSFEVTDMLGQVVYRGNTVAKGGALDTRIELANSLANGMYMLNMSVGAERKAFHFVVKQ